jgi:hypothetical protein
MKPPTSLAWATAAVVGLTGVCACEAGQDKKSVTARRTESGVEITVTVSARQVKVTYRPTRPGFHVYSVEMPSGGVDGIGIPTRLGVSGGLQADGPPVADRPTRFLELRELGVTLPVYPDGPVALSLPVQRTGDTADVIISYGACSESTCLAPVVGRAIHLTLPRSNSDGA